MCLSYLMKNIWLSRSQHSTCQKFAFVQPFVLMSAAIPSLCFECSAPPTLRFLSGHLNPLVITSGICTACRSSCSTAFKDQVIEGVTIRHPQSHQNSLLWKFFIFPALSVVVPVRGASSSTRARAGRLLEAPPVKPRIPALPARALPRLPVLPFQCRDLDVQSRPAALLQKAFIVPALSSVRAVVPVPGCPRSFCARLRFLGRYRSGRTLLPARIGALGRLHLPASPVPRSLRPACPPVSCAGTACSRSTSSFDLSPAGS